MSVAKFRKKPVVIEAIQIPETYDGVQEIIDWVNSHNHQFKAEDSGTWTIWYDREMRIKTLEGEMTAKRGDWIIRGVKGEFYPCKPDIFEKTYERVVE